MSVCKVKKHSVTICQVWLNLAQFLKSGVNWSNLTQFVKSGPISIGHMSTVIYHRLYVKCQMSTVICHRLYAICNRSYVNSDRPYVKSDRSYVKSDRS